MPLFNVHLYREMKLRFDNVNAATAQEAAGIVRPLPATDAEDLAECDGNTFAALIDVVGDEDFGQSRMIDFEPERVRKLAAGLLAALEQALPILEAYAEGIRLRSGGLCRSEAYDNALAVIASAGQGYK